ncbi:hypothetical protein TRAPUB_13391 [Trametes pubescens]|uniref:Uncharacterized protein n=1 Tax=Trametes pubescens TaxID=154538 RepID=A0A1M2VRE1_TRAPU|nr:hypothetical protein TRAPUB_13391 [Trametes pubescens]
MSIPIEQTLQWDRVARELGPTPVYDESGHIVPIGKPMRGKPIYVVWRGRAIGLGLCGAMVLGFPGSLYEGFKTYEQAYQAWLDGPPWSTFSDNWSPPSRPCPAIPTPGYTGDTGSPPSSGTKPTTSLAASNIAPAASATWPPAERCSRASGDDSLHCGELYKDLLEIESKIPPASPIRPSSITVSMRRKAPSSPVKTTMLEVQDKVQPSSSTKKQGTHQAISSPAATVSSLASTATSTVVVPEGKVYVVVRGATPGVYTDKETAGIMMGTARGGKVSAFRSRRKGEAFYQQELQAGRVGQPIMEGDVGADYFDPEEAWRAGKEPHEHFIIPSYGDDVFRVTDWLALQGLPDEFIVTRAQMDNEDWDVPEILQEKWDSCITAPKVMREDFVGRGVEGLGRGGRLITSHARICHNRI